MPGTRRLRLCLAWLALCAMCFGAVAPTVSRVLAVAGTGITWADICGEHDPAQLAAAGADSSKAPQPPAVTGDYCGYCALVHQLPFMPTAPQGFALAVAVFPASYVAIATGFQPPAPKRRSHAPRAPPALA